MGTGGLFLWTLGWTLATGQDVPFLLHGKAGSKAATQGGTQTQTLTLGSLAQRRQGSCLRGVLPAVPTAPLVPGACGQLPCLSFRWPRKCAWAQTLLSQRVAGGLGGEG